MITAGSIVGTYGNATFTLSNLTTSGGIGIESVTWSPTMAGDELPNPDQSGAAPTYVQNRSQVITVTGKILGTTAAGAITNLNALADAVLPDQGVPSTQAHGRLKLTFPTAGELYADFVTLAWEPEITVESGESAAFLIPYTWVCRNPYGYWRTTASDAVYKL